MGTYTEVDLEGIGKRIRSTTLRVGAPGALLIGLGLTCLFGPGAEVYHLIPLLDNAVFLYGLVVIGSALLVWGFILLVPLQKRRSVIEKAIDHKTDDQEKLTRLVGVAKGLGALLFAAMLAGGAMTIMEGNGTGWLSLIIGMMGVYDFASRPTRSLTLGHCKMIIVLGGLSVIAFLVLLTGISFGVW